MKHHHKQKNANARLRVCIADRYWPRKGTNRAHEKKVVFTNLPSRRYNKPRIVNGFIKWNLVRPNVDNDEKDISTFVYTRVVMLEDLPKEAANWQSTHLPGYPLFVDGVNIGAHMPCNKCDGYGRLHEHYYDDNHELQYGPECPECKGMMASDFIVVQR